MNEIKFIDNDILKLEDTLKKGYEEIMKVTVKDGDPINDFISWITYIFSITNNNINFTGKMNLLRYATGTYLEALGELVGVKRNLARGAKATIKYTFSKIFDQVITIPKGHKVAAEGLYFELEENIELQIGRREVIGEVTCLSEGEIGNDLQNGEINTIVDDVPYLYSVENITISSGGADEESDDNLRERIKLKPTSFSTAGPVAAYRYYTLTAHQDIADANIYTPQDTPGVVKVIPLLKNGEIPEEEVLKIVKEILSADDIRPFTDKVEVIAPVASNYSINFKWWLNRDSDKTIVENKINQAVEEYKQWQKEKLGRDINPNKLIQLLIQAGAKRVEITSPIFTKIERTHVAQDITTMINYQGVEDE
ncbi:baseplate J/gp47 family protein [uncultured Fusobacterium sp.]|uniref:baseplate assembly protein n=1 Tax=uncultured Fusobacterium sp. TaxID=159267 RepID=UPI0025E819FB|nr:baseplate J/gp47 family protein [uncultured Fusobacterium sp.]